MSGLFTRALIAPIRWYQRVISPFRPRTCRFHPTCSAYAVRALEVHGPFVGTWLAVRRLGRCHPWTPGGVDHVPPRDQWRSIKPPYQPRSGDASSAERPADDPDGDAGESTATRSRRSIDAPSSLTSTRAGSVRPVGRVRLVRAFGISTATTGRQGV